MTIQYIRWDLLVPSPRNVRKVKADVTGLALSLAADGLIQNLVVSPREDGTYEVVAGERRRRAIVQLVKAGTWERDVEVACEVRDATEATTVSYAENSQRVAMHPADAIRAFAALSAEGHDEAAIANRYGYDPREVRRMLALANLSPKVLNALAADKIDLPCAQAFTLTDDHKRQERVLRHARTAHEVRQQLTETKVTTGHRLFRFVGAEAYAAAGGTMTGDLFATDGEGYADDADLVQRLADEKLDCLTSEAEAEGWGEVIAAVQQPYQVYSWHSLRPDAEREPTEEEAAALAAAEAGRQQRLAELAEMMGEDADEVDETEDDEGPFDDDALADHGRAIVAIRQGLRVHSDEAKARGVLVLVVAADGGVTRSAYTKQMPRSAASGGTVDTTPLPRPLYDARMTEELSRMRTQALQTEVARNQRLAHAVLLDTLLALVTTPFSRAHAVQLRSGPGGQAPKADWDHNVRAMALPFDDVADLIAAVPEDPAARFDWVLSRDDGEIARLLAACTGAMIDASQPKYADIARLRSADRIARVAALDMRDHWEGGVEFFARLSKKAMLAALTEACGAPAAENCAKLGKAELAAACAERIPGRGWLPPALVTPEVAEDVVETPDTIGTGAEAGDHDAEAVDYAIAAE